MKPLGMKHSGPRTNPAATTAALSLALAAWGSPAAGQETTIHGFADVTYTVSDRDGSANTFSLGQYDLFISSRLGEKWSFLSETVFEFVGAAPVAHAARVVIEYHHNSRFRVAVGRMHNPIGYWFTQYSHGALLEPTIDRPLAFRFEDEGGILTGGQVGIRFSGRAVGAFHLGYDLVVGNGANASQVQDVNRDKSVTLRLFTQVDHATQVGGFVYRDVLAAGTPVLRLGHLDGGDPSAGGLEQDLEQQIFGAFFVHQGPRLEIQTEGLRIRHEDNTGATSNDSFYAYSGYRLGSWVPYFIFDWAGFAEHDPYYGPGTNKGGSLGLRWDALATTVVKAEARQEYHAAVTFRKFTIQVAVGF